MKFKMYIFCNWEKDQIFEEIEPVTQIKTKLEWIGLQTNPIATRKHQKKKPLAKSIDYLTKSQM